MVGVAQLVERRIVTPVVGGSSPLIHPSFPLLDCRFLSLSARIGQLVSILAPLSFPLR